MIPVCETHFPEVPPEALAKARSHEGNPSFSVGSRIGLAWRTAFYVPVDGAQGGLVLYRPSLERRADAVRAALRGEGRIPITREDILTAIQTDPDRFQEG